MPLRHNPVDFTTGLASRLATRSRHVCLFLGAGASKACGLPDVQLLQNQVLNGLKSDAREIFAKLLDGRNLEQVLTRLRRIHALLDEDGFIDGLTGKQASHLDSAVCEEIVKALEITKADLDPMRALAA